ncbi:hypothetical protein MLD38_028610 [Melastoma candidum]|uniref:Uncharacterized protein n=1 Tax=Melastoma candidum TaxID=119954 RepID=A0ACB9N191_9MYRT|nr:hypothetical protein MLD38_028610 [Melastoma candidum]
MHKIEKYDGLKLLSAATTSVVSPRTRFKRKDAKTVSKSLTKLLVKRLKGHITFIPKHSTFVSQEEIDEVLAPMFEALGLKTFCEFYSEGSVAKDFEKNEPFNIIVRQKVSLKNYMESTRLDLRLRVLHHAVLFSLLPHAGSNDTIMLADAKVMVHLLEGIPFSLGALIFEHMKWSLSRREKSLPYCQVIASLLQMYGIDRTPASEQEKWKVGNFGANVINNMQYVKTTEGWLTKHELFQTIEAQHYELLQKKAPSAAVVAKGKKHAKGLHASQKGSAPPAVETSASSALPSILKELQLQVAAQCEDI